MAPDPPHAPRSRARFWLAGLVGVALAVLVAEGLLRAFCAPTTLLDPGTDAHWRAEFRAAPALAPDIEIDPILGWRMRRGLRAEGVTHDDAGHRVTPSAVAIDPALRSIVLLGDSFTYGLGVRDEETYAARLASVAAGRAVWNLAANGHGLDQQVLAFETEGGGKQPELVILGYFLDDFRRNGLSFREYAKPRFVVDGDALRLASEQVPDLDAVRHAIGSSSEIPSYAWAAVLALKRRVQKTRGSFESDADFSAHADLSERLLARLSGDVRAVGAKLVVLVIPHCSYDAYPDARRTESAIEASCVKLAIPCFSTTRECRSAEAEGLAVFGQNCHWSAAGHARIASFLVARLAELDIRF